MCVIVFFRMYEYIYTLRKKIASLQGDSFDPKMSVEDYQRLINIQKVLVNFFVKSMSLIASVADVYEYSVI